MNMNDLGTRIFGMSHQYSNWDIMPGMLRDAGAPLQVCTYLLNYSE